MSLFNSFDRTKHFSELADPIIGKATGTMTAAARRLAAVQNLTGDSNIALADFAVLATLTALTATAAELNILAGATLTVAELNRLDDSLASNGLAKGAGVSAMESYAAGIFRAGSLIKTQIVIDLTGLVGSATDLDIIGNSGGAASANLGQITAAKSGTLIGGKVTCLEVPAGGADDVDFYSATVGTGSQDVDVTTLTETALVTSGGAWTSGQSKGMTLLPAADDYLYVVNGEAVGGTYTAGKFLIELYGLGA